ncbi:DUF1589 domain-containing protein [Rhodopirellula baltica]
MRPRPFAQPGGTWPTSTESRQATGPEISTGTSEFWRIQPRGRVGRIRV